MGQYAKLQLENKLRVGAIGIQNGKRILFQKHGQTILPHDRNVPDPLEYSGQDSILVESQF